MSRLTRSGSSRRSSRRSIRWESGGGWWRGNQRPVANGRTDLDVRVSQKHVLGHLGYQNVDIETLATLVSRGRLDLSRSISDIVSLEDVRVGIEKLERQEGNPIRILVKP